MSSLSGCKPTISQLSPNGDLRVEPLSDGAVRFAEALGKALAQQWSTHTAEIPQATSPKQLTSQPEKEEVFPSK